MADEEVIDDQYQLVMCIASGSSSQVWEVVEKASSRHLAMKLVKKDVPEFKENKVKMKREGEILKSLDHPMIVKFEKFSSNRDHTYILMEHFRASNLKIQIKADLNKVHLKIRQLFEGVCAALSHVHSKGYIHRDIKPDNVLMNRAGEIRLCDFSLSSKEIKGFGRYFAGKVKTIQGTRTYIAPETIRRQQPTFKTDLYSLGVLFFEVLTAKTPFQAPTPEELLQKHLRVEPSNPSEHNKNVSPEMDRIIARLLKKKPADRPGSVDEVLSELKRIRIFKEDIVDAEAEKKANEDNDAIAMLSESRLDSRADAKLKHLLETNAEFAQKFAAEKQLKAAKKKGDVDRQNARIKIAEDADTAKKARNAPAAAPVAAQPQPVPQPMPMQMPCRDIRRVIPRIPRATPPTRKLRCKCHREWLRRCRECRNMRRSRRWRIRSQCHNRPGRPPSSPHPPAPPATRPATAAGVPAAAQQKAPGTAPKPGNPASAKPAASAPARPAPKPAAPAQPAEDIDFMTELPDVL